jgi:dienelactone hydrolase
MSDLPRPSGAPNEPGECVLDYADGDTPLRGYLYGLTPGASGGDGPGCGGRPAPAPRPGLLLVHGGAGLDRHARDQGRRYAALGYVVLACDMFGPAVAGNRERILETVVALRDDPGLLVRRGRAALTALSQVPETDGRLGAVGFCFGGLVVLTLARAGLDLAAVVSMHGSLATARPAGRGAVRARVLVCHGARDPHVPMSDVTAFAQEMTAAEADWRLTMYGGAVHGFTHEHAAPGAHPGVEYDRETDELSFAEARAFLARALSAGEDTDTDTAAGTVRS